MSTSGDRELSPGALPPDPGPDLRLECERLRELLTVAESALATLSARCEDLEEDKAHLGRLCVASVQLHDIGGGEADALRSVQDVLVNLIGSEQLAIWSVSPDGRRLELRASQGIDAEAWRSVTMGEGLVGKAAVAGEVRRGEAEEPGQPTVCIPLILGRRVVGLVAVFGLLPHRPGFAPRDQDVFRLVSQQAAFALCCAGGPWGNRRSPGG